MSLLLEIKVIGQLRTPKIPKTQWAGDLDFVGSFLRARVFFTAKGSLGFEGPRKKPQGGRPRILVDDHLVVVERTSLFHYANEVDPVLGAQKLLEFLERGARPQPDARHLPVRHPALWVIGWAFLAQLGLLLRVDGAGWRLGPDPLWWWLLVVQHLLWLLWAAVVGDRVLGCT